MDIRSHKDNLCYLVWKNTILEPRRQGGWINSNGIWGGSELWRRQSIRWCHDTYWKNKGKNGSEQFWGPDLVLTEADLLPGTNHAFCKMGNRIILFVRVNKSCRVQSHGEGKWCKFYTTRQGGQLMEQIILCC